MSSNEEVISLNLRGLQGRLVHQQLMQRSSTVAMLQAAQARAASFSGSGTGYMYPDYDAPADIRPPAQEVHSRTS